MIDICILGTGGMLPLPNRFLSSMVLRINGKMILVDCGEGTQVALRQCGWGFKSIDAICITHFHADHISGLPGLLLTIGNSGRENPLTIIGPQGLSHIVNSLLVIAGELPFPIRIIEFPQEICETSINDIKILCCPADHKTACLSYRFELKRVGRFDVEKAKLLNIPKPLWSKLQKGEELLINDVVYKKEMVLGPERKGIVISFTTDTRPTAQLTDFVKNSDLLVAEGIYSDNDKKNKALEYKHMLYSEAATMAKEADVKRLILTHFSPSLVDTSENLESATSIFENTEPGCDGMMIPLFFDE